MAIKQKKVEDIIVVLSLVLVLIFLIYLYIRGFSNYKTLEKNGEYASATIVDFYSGVRQNWYLRYEFTVDDKKYRGEGQYYPKSDKFAVGDKIFVIYNRTNPNNNEAYRRYEQTENELYLGFPFFILLYCVLSWRAIKK